jgi:2-polyprenyl-6-methoxyphenol hydroxylase-like FAD-dependent oxidoreductase
MDPLTAQGMGHALRDAELLSEAIVAGTTVNLIRLAARRSGNVAVNAG